MSLRLDMHVPDVSRIRELTSSLVEEIDKVVRGISPESPHRPEGVEQKWPQMRVVRLDTGTTEIRIGSARWVISDDRWDEAGDFIDRVRALWDMRVVWADTGTPVDGDCAKRLLEENEKLRQQLAAVARADAQGTAAAWEQANNYIEMYQASQREIDRLRSALSEYADHARNSGWINLADEISSRIKGDRQ